MTRRHDKPATARRRHATFDPEWRWWLRKGLVRHEIDLADEADAQRASRTRYLRARHHAGEQACASGISASQTTPQQRRNKRATIPLTAQFACPTRAARRTAAETTRQDHIPTLQPPTLSSDTSSCPRSRRRANADRRTSNDERERVLSSSHDVLAQRKRAGPRSHGVASGGPASVHCVNVLDWSPRARALDDDDDAATY